MHAIDCLVQNNIISEALATELGAIIAKLPDSNNELTKLIAAALINPEAAVTGGATLAQQEAQTALLTAIDALLTTQSSLLTTIESESFSDERYAEDRIFAAFGDRISIKEKAKILSKFGQTTSVGTTFKTVGEFQGATLTETFVSTNIIDQISSGSISDAGKTFVLEGHTVDGSGNFTFVIQDVRLNLADGRTPVLLTTPLARASRLYLKSSGTFNAPQVTPVGIIYVYDNTDGHALGVPVTAAATKITIQAGETQSRKCQTTISSEDYWILTQFTAAVGAAGNSASFITVRIERRDTKNGGAWRPIGRSIVLQTGQNGVFVPFKPFEVIPKNHDVRVVARTDTNTASVLAELDGYLAQIIV